MDEARLQEIDHEARRLLSAKLRLVDEAENFVGESCVELVAEVRRLQPVVDAAQRIHWSLKRADGLNMLPGELRAWSRLWEALDRAALTEESEAQ
jgi:hypothetical protein